MLATVVDNGHKQDTIQALRSSLSLLQGGGFDGPQESGGRQTRKGCGEQEEVTGYVALPQLAMGPGVSLLLFGAPPPLPQMKN